VRAPRIRHPSSLGVVWGACCCSVGWPRVACCWLRATLQTRNHTVGSYSLQGPLRGPATCAAGQLAAVVQGPVLSPCQSLSSPSSLSPALLAGVSRSVVRRGLKPTAIISVSGAGACFWCAFQHVCAPSLWQGSPVDCSCCLATGVGYQPNSIPATPSSNGQQHGCLVGCCSQTSVCASRRLSYPPPSSTHIPAEVVCA